MFGMSKIGWSINIPKCTDVLRFGGGTIILATKICCQGKITRRIPYSWSICKYPSYKWNLNCKFFIIMGWLCKLWLYIGLLIRRMCNVRQCPSMSVNVHVRFDSTPDNGHYGHRPTPLILSKGSFTWRHLILRFFDPLCHHFCQFSIRPFRLTPPP